MLTIFDKIFNRSASRVYVIFVFWIVLFHLPVIYVALFTNEELLFKREGILKGEYILKHFYPDWASYLTYIYPTVSLVFSALLTYAVIYQFSKRIVMPAYRAELDAQYERRKMRQDKEIELQERRAMMLQVEEGNLKQERKNIQDEQVNKQLRLQDEDVWLREYNKLKNNDSLVKSFSRLLDIVYSERGAVSRDDQRALFFKYAHTNGLVLIKRNNEAWASDVISLTDKGKFFAAQYLIDYPERSGTAH